MKALKLLWLIVVVGLSMTASAEPCQDFANQYARDPDSMSDEKLANLRTCVDETLQARLFRGPPPGGGMPAPPPIPRPTPGEVPLGPAPAR